MVKLEGTMPEDAAPLPVRAYSRQLVRALEACAEAEAGALLRAGQLLADTVAAGGVIHLFGSGHSALVAADPVGRSGSLACLNQVLDRTEDLAERLPGYGVTLAEFYDQQYGLEEGESLIVISNSGINPLPVELAREGIRRGLNVIAITNVAQSRAQEPRVTGGKRLFEVADVVLDNHAPPGEAILELPGLDVKVATAGTVTGVFLVNAALAACVQELIRRGLKPPVFTSENTGDPTADSRNAALRRRYRGRLRRFGV